MSGRAEGAYYKVKADLPWKGFIHMKIKLVRSPRFLAPILARIFKLK